MSATAAAEPKAEDGTRRKTEIGIVTSDDLIPLLAKELIDLGSGIEDGVDASESR